MANKPNIRVCRYKQCKHTTRNIDIENDDYVAKKSMYFHKDCYRAKLNCEWKNDEVKKDLQFIKTLWYEHISKTVVYSDLFRVLNNLIERGVDSKYLVFVMEYIVAHKLNLNYPAGFRYFVDKKEIKEAYAKKNLLRSTNEKRQTPIAPTNDNEPNFSFTTKKKGFQNIFNRG